VKPHRDAALEAAIIANPDDDAAYLVYADWLLARGDPRGDLIALQHADKPESAALLEQHLGDWLGISDLGRVRLTWRWGFIHTAVAFPPIQYGELLLRQLVASILSSPLAIAIRALALSGSSGQVARAIPAQPPSTLQSLSMTLIGPRHPDTKRCMELADHYTALGVTVHAAHDDGFPRY
jgi:uncharacterized protein (TIGR02996 family)